MSIDTILIITVSKFDQRDFKRFGLPEFIEANFKVIVIDISRLIRSSQYINTYEPKHEIKDDYVFKIQSIEEFIDVLKCYELNKSIALCYFSIDRKTQIIFKEISQLKLPYGCFYLGVHPSHVKWIRKLASKLKLFLYKNILWKRITPALFIVTAGKKSQRDIPFVLNNKTRLLKAGSIDYCAYRELIKNEWNENKSEYDIVFIDEVYPNHPDLDGRILINTDKYYILVNQFLIKFSTHLNLKCCIAVHPRANYPTNPYKFPLVENQTAELIARSKYVVGHGSTAFSFAVLFRKQIVLLEFKTTADSIYGICLTNYAKELDLVKYNLEAEYKIQSVPEINQIKYKTYELNYLFAGEDESVYYYPKLIVDYCLYLFDSE